jgi:hypothetical protein
VRRTRIRFRPSREYIIPFTALLNFNRSVAHQCGDVLVALCCGDHASGISDGSLTESTSGGCTQRVFGLRRRRPRKIGAAVPRHHDPRPGPMLIRSRAPGHSMWLAHPTTGCPVSACSGAGQTPIDTIPGGFGGRGECVASGTSVSHRVSSGRLWPCNTFGTGRKAMSPFPLPPVLRLRRFIPRTFTWVKPSVLSRRFWAASRSRSGRGFVWREGSASHRSDWLPASGPLTHIFRTRGPPIHACCSG